MLLRQSEADIRLARYAISTGDAFMCDIAIFHCGQANERLLKFILQKYGGIGENKDDESIRTHDMAVLIDLVERRTAFYVPDRLKELADDLTGWRVEARYGDQHVGSLSVAADLIRCYEEIRIELEIKNA